MRENVFVAGIAETKGGLDLAILEYSGYSLLSTSSIQGTEKRVYGFSIKSLYHFPFYDVDCVRFAALKLVIVLACFCDVNVTLSM